MRYPNFFEERKLWKRGYKCVACLDEVGRGAGAGPVLAAAVVVMIKISNFQFLISNKFPISNFQTNLRRFDFCNLRDSKKLTPEIREKFYKVLTNHPIIEWAIGKVSEKKIDKINILEATKLAMTRAIEKLKTKLPFMEAKVKKKTKSSSPLKNKKLKIDYLILDGRMKLDLIVPQKSIVKGDEKVFSCAVASIIAKVTRDRIMRKYHQKYPQYGFDKHKGYLTKRHRKMLKKYGPSLLHRLSFSPVKDMVKLTNKI